MKSSSDDPVVVTFNVTFQKLKEWADDDPSTLQADAERDESLRSLCHEVILAALRLELAELQHRELIVRPANPTFVRLWREYDDRYAPALAAIFLKQLGHEPAANVDSRDALRTLLENALNIGRAKSVAVDAAIAFAADEIEERSRSSDDESVLQVQEGVRVWQTLSSHTGLNLGEVFRRRHITPVTLVPRQVANRYGNEPLALHNLLQQAQEAFIFGVPLASVALCRALLERILADLYGSTHRDLDQAINGVPSLPRSVTRSDLHAIRKLANRVLHGGSEGVPENLEVSILQALGTIRTLIEQTPPSPREPTIR